MALQLVRDFSVNRAICNQKYSPSEKIKNDKMGPNVKSQKQRSHVLTVLPFLIISDRSNSERNWPTDSADISASGHQST